MKVFIRAVLVLAAVCVSQGATAHDLGGARAWLVQYDDRHLTLTLLVSLTDIIRNESSNPDQYKKRLMTLSAMSPTDFENEFNKLENHIRRETRIRLNGVGEAVISNWSWPDPLVARSQIQLVVMNALSGGVITQVHEEPIEVHAEVSSSVPIKTAAMQFPRELGPVLLVAYHPVQVIVDKQGFATKVPFFDPSKALKQ